MDTKKEITRRDLYELIWSRPQREVARTLSINKWDLPHLCEKHKIPRPESGYWTKGRFGGFPVKPELPPTDHENAVILTVKPSKSDLVDPDFLARAEGLVAREKDPGMTVEPVRELRDMHPFVAEAQRRLAKMTPNYMGVVEVRGHFIVRVTPKQVDRALLLLETLMRACDKRGYRVGAKKEARLAILDVGLRVELKEKLHQKDNPEFYTVGPYGHAVGYRHLFQQTGNLILKVGRLRVADTVGKPIESRMHEVMGLLVQAAINWHRTALEEDARQREREMEWAERRHREQEIIQKRQEVKRLKDKERARVEHLELEVKNWNRSRRIREYVDVVREFLINRDGEIQPGSDGETWLGWATAQADRYDPLCHSPHSILDEPDL